MTAELSDTGEFISVSGNTCPRGAAYAAQECTRPTRMVTAVLPVAGCSLPLSVRTSVPVPKDMIFRIMELLGNKQVIPPVSAGDVIVHDILSTGADIIATRSVGA